MEFLEEKEIEALVPSEKVKHSEWRSQQPMDEPIPEGATREYLMRRKLRTEQGRARYKLRQESVEPVFGFIKEELGLRQFLLRGLDKVSSMWRLTCAAHNLWKLYRARASLSPAG